MNLGSTTVSLLVKHSIKRLQNVITFIIHQCDPTVLISYLIWPCDIAVHITYLISHSSSVSYNTVIKGYFILVYNKYKTTLVC